MASSATHDPDSSPGDDSTDEDDDAVTVSPVSRSAVTGDLVWEDANGNGVQEADDPGLAGVTVRLLSETGVELSSTTTDAGGHYTFTALLPGAYIIEVVAPAGYRFTEADRGGDDARDSDINPTTGRTAVIVLPDGATDTTQDAGLFRPVSAGGQAWHDLNGNAGRDAGEPGVPGVMVTLYYSSGLPVLVNGLPLTTTTGADGKYLFTGLAPGDYRVGFDLTTLPHGYGAVPPDRGDDTTDSDADITGRTPATGLLRSGGQNLTLDLGIAAPDLVLSKVGLAQAVEVGKVVTYSLTYTNQGSGIALQGFLQETMPEHTQFVAGVSSPGWDCADGAAAGTTCRLALDALLPGSRGEAFFAVRVARDIPIGVTQIVNAALVGSETGELDPTTPDNRDDATTGVSRPTALPEEEQPDAPEHHLLLPLLSETGDVTAVAQLNTPSPRVFLPSLRR